MTHDELLAKVRDNPTTRAVVELHKPWESKHDNLIMCNHCCSEIYPCPTLKAIQKELI